MYLTPREPKLVLGKHLPLHAVAEAMARALLTEWSTNLKVITRGAETTAIRSVFKVGLNEEELALQFRLVYSERSNKSIDIIHKDKKAVETSISYICTKELLLKGHNEDEKITVEVFAAGYYKIYKEDITTALKNIGLIITIDVHQPAMGSSCPLLSNKMITIGSLPRGIPH